MSGKLLDVRSGNDARPRSLTGLIGDFKIQLYLHVVGVAQKNLPTSAIGYLIHAEGYAVRCCFVDSKPRLAKAI